jgi:hypothetical protein
VSPERAKSHRAAVDQIQAVRRNDAAYSMPVLLDRARWQTCLLKNRFQIAVRSGKVADIKLRCDKQYLFFRYEASVQHRVASRDDQTCSIEIVGDPGTMLDLIQSWSLRVHRIADTVALLVRGAISEPSNGMAHHEGEASNPLFAILGDWAACLKKSAKR